MDRLWLGARPDFEDVDPGASITTAQNFPSGQVTLPNGTQAQYGNGMTSVPVTQVNAALAAGFTAVIGPLQSQ